MKLVLSIILSVFSVLFLLLAPAAFLPELNKNIYTVREEHKQEKFQGFLTLWHVSDYPNTARAYLNRTIKRIEKDNLHVFIEAENLNTQTALDRMQKGEFPDILSFSAGFLKDTSPLCPLRETEAIIPRLLQTGEADGILYACPYMVTALFPDAEAELTESSAIKIHVQYIAFAKTTDQKKHDLYAEIAESLLDAEMQKSLTESKGIPVLANPGLYDTEDNYSMVYEALFQSLHFRNVFSGELV